MTDCFSVLTSTADELHHLLQSGSITSKQLVNAYVSQIEKYDDYLHAVIAVAPKGLLLQRAEALDHERDAGKARSRIHGIPILLKDNISNHPDLGLDTTAGSFALVNSKPKQNSVIVDKAGAIVLGKANLFEFSGHKGAPNWSAVGGLVQSAYVQGGCREDDSSAGHSYPGGSSSGSAVGVSAGYAPFSIGTDTAGSITIPAGRAALYAMKPTIGLISTSGIVPITKFFDSPGPMAKSAIDIALLLDILVDAEQTEVPDGGYISAITRKWDGLKIGTLDPEKWTLPPDVRKVLDPSGEEQLNQDVRRAYVKIGKLAPSFHVNVPLITPCDLKLDGKGVMGDIFSRDFKLELAEYLQNLEHPRIRSLADLIQFNKDNSEKELPPEYPSQGILEHDQDLNLSDCDYHLYTTHFRRAGREGIDSIFHDYDLNIIAGPSDSDITVLAAASGYPIATLPLGYLDFNGRPHSLAAIAGEHQEALLVQLQSAWEASFPKRKPPLLQTQVPSRVR